MNLHPKGETVNTKNCPKCGGELILFYPNIPWLTGWYCVNNDHAEPATEQEVNEELARREADDGQDV